MTDMTHTALRDKDADLGGESLEAATEHRGFSFADMHLTVGDRLQIECPSATGMGRAFVRVVGYLEPASILVTAPMVGNTRIDLVEHDLVVVRVFSRKSAFAFRASVLRACRLPFHYLHLSFPQVIQGSVIRKATRVRADLPVTITRTDSPDAVPGTILNISSTGLLLRTQATIGERDGQVRLQFNLPLHDIDTRLELDASIRNVREEAVEEGTEFQYGLDFHELPPNDRMMVKSFVYQTIIEYPRRII